MPAPRPHSLTGEQLTFRWAVAGDVDPAVALVESAYRGEASREGWTTEADLLDGQRTDAEAVAALVAPPGSRLLVAEVAPGGGPLVACCQLEREDPVTAYFGMFAVRPGQQGLGVGRRMVAEAERRARTELGASTMRMTVIAQRADLIAWYERLGYRATGAREPFPYGDPRFGVPRRDDLHFVVLSRPLGARLETGVRR